MANLVKQEKNKNLLLAKSLNHLMLAPTSDKQTITLLVKSNATLKASIETWSRKLEQALNTIAILSKVLNNRFPTTKQRRNMQLNYDLQMDLEE